MRKLLLAAALLAFAWGAVVYASGGVAFRIDGVWLRSRDPYRALLIGLALLLLSAAFYRDAFRGDTDRATGLLRRFAVPLAATAALALALIGIRFGTFSAGSSDSYGYVNQAYGWARGQLPRGSPVPISLPWGVGDRLQAPLGYRLGPEPRTLVPTYAPGLPLMMAAAILTLGACGPYLIVPACGAILVWFTFIWGRQAAGPVAGLIAAFIVLVSPIVVFQVLWPMSDIPAAALWTAAAVAALRDTRKSAIVAGLLTAAGLLVRPNLPLVVLVPLAQIVLTARGRERWIRPALAVIPIALVAIVLARLNVLWFGGVLNSGYGAASELYSWASVKPNLARYPVWFWQAHSGWILAGLVPLIPGLQPRSGRAPIRLAWVLLLATLVSYIAYYPFEDWWYIRFLLPAIGAIGVLIATGIVTLGRRLPSPWGALAVLTIIVLMAVHTTSFSTSHDMFGGVKGQERRYIDVGAFVARSLPANALVLTMQHSGAVRFYGGRLSLRYDFLERGWINTGPAQLEKLGYHPYMVIDDWETRYVREQFDLPSDTPLPWTLVARMDERGGVSVFDMATNPGVARPVLIRSGVEPLCDPPRPIVIQPRQ